MVTSATMVPSRSFMDWPALPVLIAPCRACSHGVTERRAVVGSAFDSILKQFAWDHSVWFFLRRMLDDFAVGVVRLPAPVDSPGNRCEMNQWQFQLYPR